MTYLLARSAVRNGFNMEKRRARRWPVEVGAWLSDQAARFDVDVTDLSLSGFRAESSVALRLGAPVWLTLPGLAALEASVAWRDRYRYGCAFTLPLSAALIDRIVAGGGG